MLNEIIAPMSKAKAKLVATYCSKFAKGKILDVGSGRCLIAKELKDMLNADIRCIDIADMNETDIELTVYDGKTIPYKKNTFDTIIIVYVLHHCDKPEDVIKECARVAKKNGRIIIFEDFGFKPMIYLLDLITNKVIHNVNTPLNFKKEKEWTDIFNRNKLSIETIERNVKTEKFYPFVKHNMFVLKKV